MDVKTTIPITEARRTLFEVAKAVQRPGVRYTFTDKGRPKVVLMSAEDYESWQETFEVMHQFPNLKKDVAQAERDLALGNYLTLGQIKAKYKISQHGVSNRRSIKRTKRSR